MKEITRTSAQYREEQRLKVLWDDDTVCPECGELHKGFSTILRYEGFFTIKEWDCYSCRNCGCEWKVRK